MSKIRSTPKRNLDTMIRISMVLAHKTGIVRKYGLVFCIIVADRKKIAKIRYTFNVRYYFLAMFVCLFLFLVFGGFFLAMQTLFLANKFK